MLTLLFTAGVAMWTAGLPGPAAIILGGALAMSSTAVAIQVVVMSMHHTHHQTTTSSNHHHVLTLAWEKGVLVSVPCVVGVCVLG